ncbi:MAG: hypothetical protein AAGK23_13635, partial [Pseudomonadota bacterium]
EFFDDVVETNRRPSQMEASEPVGEDYLDEYVGVVQIDARNNRRFYDYETVRCNQNGRGRTNCDNYTDYAGRFYHESTCVSNRIGSNSYILGRNGNEAFTDAPPGNNAYIFANHPLWDYRDNFDEINERADFRDKFDGQDEVEDQVGQFRDGGRGRSSGVVNARGDDTTVDDRGTFTFTRRSNQCRSEGRPLPLTNNTSALNSYIRNMRASNGTAGHLGIAWGWYLLSPRWSGIWPSVSRPLEYDEEDTAKAMILMTDGDFNDQHPFAADGSTELAARYCDRIREDTNITVFTVGFQVPNNVATVGNTGQTILQYCATRPEFQFDASNAQELSDAYNNIAATISDLRITN